MVDIVYNIYELAWTGIILTGFAGLLFGFFANWQLRLILLGLLCMLGFVWVFRHDYYFYRYQILTIVFLLFIFAGAFIRNLRQKRLKRFWEYIDAPATFTIVILLSIVVNATGQKGTNLGGDMNKNFRTKTELCQAIKNDFQICVEEKKSDFKELKDFKERHDLSGESFFYWELFEEVESPRKSKGTSPVLSKGYVTLVVNDNKGQASAVGPYWIFHQGENLGCLDINVVSNNDKLDDYLHSCWRRVGEKYSKEEKS
jgi:hypothetical protein